MKIFRALPLGLALICAGSAAGSFWKPADKKFTANATIDNWTGISKLAAKRLVQTYGAPDEVKSSRLTWHNRGPWKRIVVWDETPLYVSDQPLDVLEMTVAYRVPEGKVKEVEAFSRAITANPRKDELSVRSDNEETCRLVLNLANEIALGLRRGDEAAKVYADVITLSASGKESPYTERLLFESNL